MAYQHYIQRVQEMDPKGNNNFFTTYYNASKAENKLLSDYVLEFVCNMVQDLQSDGDPAAQIYGQPLGGKHKTKKGEEYTLASVIMDLSVQMQHKNATKSMIDRWNVAMSKIGCFDKTIDIEIGARPQAGRLPNNLFNFGDDA